MDCYSPALCWKQPVCENLCRGWNVLLGQADELCESLGVFDRHVGEDFAVQRHIGLLQGVDETSIAQALCSYRRTDARDPQLAEVPLAILSTGVGVGQSLVYALRGRSKQPTLCPVLT